MLEGWLWDAYARQWWGDPETELELFRTAWDTGEAVGYVASINNVQTAFIQSWLPSEFDEEPRQQEFPYDAVGVDIFVCPSHKTSQGFGVTIIRALQNGSAAKEAATSSLTRICAMFGQSPLTKVPGLYHLQSGKM
jgi:aminoglycoside 6'-N-acetyltransferase